MTEAKIDGLTDVYNYEAKSENLIKRAEALLFLISESHWITKWMMITNYNYVIRELKKITRSSDREQNRRIICKALFIYYHSDSWDDAVVKLTQMLQLEGIQ